VTPVEAEGGSILVVDDAIRRMIARILQRAGYACTDPAAALLVADAHDIDLVMCDVNMPGGSGLALIRDLRELARVPVLRAKFCAWRDPQVGVTGSRRHEGWDGSWRIS
jgi:CheY-like chemotaxis protein